jgi:preprotein translocase subunit SecD
MLGLCALGLAGGFAGCSQFQSDQPAGDGVSTTGTMTPTTTATAPGGTVEVVASYPVQVGETTEQHQQTVLTEDDFASVGSARKAGQGRPPRVPATLTDAAAEDFVAALRERNFTSGEGVGACQPEANPGDPGYCLHTVVDGEIVYTAGVSTGLAELMESGEFSENPTFVLQTRNFSKAKQLAAALRE